MPIAQLLHKIREILLDKLATQGILRVVEVEEKPERNAFWRE